MSHGNRRERRQASSAGASRVCGAHGGQLSKAATAQRGWACGALPRARWCASCAVWRGCARRARRRRTRPPHKIVAWYARAADVCHIRVAEAWRSTGARHTSEESDEPHGRGRQNRASWYRLGSGSSMAYRITPVCRLTAWVTGAGLIAVCDGPDAQAAESNGRGRQPWQTICPAPMLTIRRG